MAQDMAVDIGKATRAHAGWMTVVTLAQADGSAAHPAPAMLASPHASARIVTDAVHLIGMLHGRHPGIIDHALGRTADSVSHDWLADAAQHFAGERAYLAKLVSIAGPLPSTPGQAETEAAVAAQRHALDMLAQSDRQGCALGAAIALVLDWRTIRTVLDAAANRLGITVPPCTLPDHAATAAMVTAAAATPAWERALAFGTQQVLAQHRGLWDLVEARASARGDA